MHPRIREKVPRLRISHSLLYQNRHPAILEFPSKTQGHQQPSFPCSVGNKKFRPWDHKCSSAFRRTYLRCFPKIKRLNQKGFNSLPHRNSSDPEFG